jgi:hypothetical protein
MPAMTTEAMRVAYIHLQPKMEQVIKEMQAKIEGLATENQHTDKK